MTVNGSSRMYLGDMIHLVIPKKGEIGGSQKTFVVVGFLHIVCVM